MKKEQKEQTKFSTFAEAKHKLHTEWKNLYETDKARWEKRLAEKDEEIKSLQEQLKSSNEELLEIRRKEVLDSSMELAVNLQVSNNHLNNFFHPLGYKEIIKKKLTKDNYLQLKNSLHASIINIACNKALAGASEGYANKVINCSSRISEAISKENNPLYLEAIEQNQELIRQVQKLTI